MATIVAFTLPVLIGFGVLAIDVGHFYSVRTQLQQSADFSALSVLTKLRDEARVDFLNVSQARIQYREAAVAAAKKNLPPAATNAAVRDYDVLFGKWDFNRERFLLRGELFPVNAVRVQAQMNRWRANPVKTMFGKIFKNDVDVNVSSIAVMPVPPSFHMLSPDASGALEMHGSADIDVYAVQVNSEADDAFVLTAREFGIGALEVAVTGGAPGVTHSRVVTGVKPVGDFLNDLPEPSFSGCRYNGFVTSDPRPVLEPGVYCGGLTITDAAEVTLNEGTYIIKEGPLVVDASMGGKEIKGDNVLIYLADEKAEMQIDGGNFSIRAKKTGKWAGIAIMAARGADAPPKHVFASTRAYFSGIFYTPDSQVEFTGGGLDGNCVYLCFVSNTLKLTSTYVNYAYSIAKNPFGGAVTLPAEPPSLKKNFRPYLLNEAKYSFN
ncbi:MAG: hypothetical protein GY948_03250 [Alphaproteobacteria bacterium]|nr:hypothetical protein [Alphaproteobacteria bacterium]